VPVGETTSIDEQKLVVVPCSVSVWHSNVAGQSELELQAMSSLRCEEPAEGSKVASLLLGPLQAAVLEPISRTMPKKRFMVIFSSDCRAARLAPGTVRRAIAFAEFRPVSVSAISDVI